MSETAWKCRSAFLTPNYSSVQHCRDSAFTLILITAEILPISRCIFKAGLMSCSIGNFSQHLSPTLSLNPPPEIIFLLSRFSLSHYNLFANHYNRPDPGCRWFCRKHRMWQMPSITLYFFAPNFIYYIGFCKDFTLGINKYFWLLFFEYFWFCSRDPFSSSVFRF